MQKTPYAQIRYVYTRVTLFYNSCVDLKWQRAIHSCDSCRVGSIIGEECGAIHYGYCSPVSSTTDSNSNAKSSRNVDNARYIEVSCLRLLGCINNHGNFLEDRKPNILNVWNFALILIKIGWT
jgi:hypothetical protein